MIMCDQDKQLAIMRETKKRNSPWKVRGKMCSDNTPAPIVMKALTQTL